MNQELKPIKVMIAVSFILHIVGLIVVSVIFMLQRQILPIFVGYYPEESTFVFLPTLQIMAIAIIFILHLVLTMGLFNAVKANEFTQIKAMSIVSFIFTAFAVPAILIFSTYFGNFFATRNMSVNELSAVFSLQNLIGFGLLFRELSMAALLVVSGMAWYYCFVKNIKNREGKEHYEQIN